VFRLVGVLSLLMLLSAVRAHAHGAPTDPPSRAFLCSPGQPTASSSPCRAAIQAGLPSKEWDNIRLPNVQGQDTLKVPDGKLCSAGLARYGGLDLASAQWPVTKLKSTGFTYRATIPHQGSFRFYVTRAGYTPSRAPRWADLEQFLTVPTPPLVNGSYEFKVQLPLTKGDVVFFNPAVMHGAGANVTSDFHRINNLLQVSSAFGRTMETMTPELTTLAAYPQLLEIDDERTRENVIAAACEGYAFPTNLDFDPPLGGLAPPSPADTVRRAVAERWPIERLHKELDEHKLRRRGLAG